MRQNDFAPPLRSTRQVAAVAVESMPWTVYTALLMTGIRVVWMAVIFLATVGAATGRTLVGAVWGAYRAVRDASVA